MGHAFYWHVDCRQVGLHSRTLVDIEIFSIRRTTLTTTHVNLVMLNFYFWFAIDIFSTRRSTITTHLKLVMLNFYFSLCMVIITWMQWSQHCGHKLINDTMFRPTHFFCLLTPTFFIVVSLFTYTCNLQHIFGLVCLDWCIFSQALYQMCLPCICMSILQDLGISLLTIILSFKNIILWVCEKSNNSN